MDVIGEHIVRFIQRRHAALQTLDRQAIGSVNTGGAQNGNGHTGLLAPSPQALLGIDPARGARTFRLEATGFIDLGPGAIPINASGTNVNQAPW